MSVTLTFSIDAKCSGCANVFQVPVDVRNASTGGELDVVRLEPSGQQHLELVELGDLPAACPNCGEPIE